MTPGEAIAGHPLGWAVVRAIAAGPSCWATPEAIAERAALAEERVLDALAELEILGVVASWEKAACAATFTPRTARWLRLDLIELGPDEVPRWAPEEECCRPAKVEDYPKSERWPFTPEEQWDRWETAGRRRSRRPGRPPLPKTPASTAA